MTYPLREPVRFLEITRDPDSDDGYLLGMDTKFFVAHLSIQYLLRIKNNILGRYYAKIVKYKPRYLEVVYHKKVDFIVVHYEYQGGRVRTTFLLRSSIIMT